MPEIDRYRNSQKWTEIEIEMTEIDRWRKIAKEIVIVIMILIVIVIVIDSDSGKDREREIGNSIKKLSEIDKPRQVSRKCQR